MKRSLITLLCAFFISHSILAQDSDRLQWFKNAKLGIFIHWGIYSVNGIDESWSFFNEYLPYEEYMNQKKGFSAANYDADYWAELIKESGAKYAVLTAKHHDGMALWDTEQGELSAVKQTPAGRDLIGPFCKALREHDIKVGLYYSLLDWSHPDYPNFTRSNKRYDNDSSRWDSFVKFNLGQIKEIATQFNPDLFWFDGDWEQNAAQWHAEEIREMLLNNNPNAILNSRLAGYGDYATPEQGVPVSKPKDEHWELCMTMNDSWGYQPNDRNFKSIDLIIRILADVIGMGGNLLLDIGPKSDGSIAEEQVFILKALGRWTQKHSEAIYGTHAGIPKDCFYGPSTLSEDSTVLYLFVPSNINSKTQAPNSKQIQNSNSKNQNRKNGQLTNHPIDQSPNPPTILPSTSLTVLLKGVTNNISTVWVVGNGTKLEQKTWLKPWWSGNPGLISIEIPAAAFDEDVTVVAVQLEGKISLRF